MRNDIGDQEKLDYAKVFFQNDRFATETTGITIEAVDDCYARCSFLVEQKHLNANNVVMGGAIFTLADFCFAVASNMSGQSTVSVSNTISYLHPMNGKKLIAESECIRRGKSVCFYCIHIEDELQTKIAIVNVTGSIIGKRD
ncbi:MAG TPA: PaaI family thioesterase [Bacillota bacterium]|nr:PaaI family thioesterase [Bacillota bacterium]HPE38609.1 PaaI family thioesterase [Bacillota bacterium]